MKHPDSPAKRTDPELPAFPLSMAGEGPILSALRHVLKPMARLMLRHGLGYPALLETLKQVFVDVAEKEFHLLGKNQTDSRIALLTGVHRKDVRRIREATAPTYPKPSLAAQVLARWMGQPCYLNENGKPKALPRNPDVNIDDGSFDALVQSVSKDIRPRALLDELLRAGIVRINDNQSIELMPDALTPKGDFKALCDFLAMNVHDHFAAAVHNLGMPEDRLFERCAFSHGLSKEEVLQLQEHIRKTGMEFLLGINEKHLQLRNKPSELEQAQSQQSNVVSESPASVEPRYRVNTGVYFYFEHQPGDEHGQ